LKIIIIFFCFFIFRNTILSAYTFNYCGTDSLVTKDSVDQNGYSDLNSIWGFRIGYFPIYGDYLESSGISGTFYNENAISKLFNLGWSFQLNKAIGSDGGYMSLSGYLSYPLKLTNNIIYLKAGLGLATYTYITPTALFEIEYLLFEFEKTAVSVSLFESIIGFKLLMPPVISIGILF
jgi:hypothetical protein